ncbi:VOC family protein [Streptomyces sp. NPDC001288]|uniref:VOC family protein n=1 Tax=unclassified Streptomyces TaxID=2593676 RepID=UPI00368BFFBB
MTSRFMELVVDCHDPERLAAFWCAALDFQVIERRRDKVEIASWVPTVEDVRARQMPPTLLFIQVPEGRGGKNRLHLDITPIDATTDQEVARLLALGATTADVGQGPDRNWVVMADPEGNEFCVLRSLAPPGHPSADPGSGAGTSPSPPRPTSS